MCMVGRINAKIGLWWVTVRPKLRAKDLEQRFSTAGTRPSTGTWRPLHRDLNCFRNFKMHQIHHEYISKTLAQQIFIDRDRNFKISHQQGLEAQKVESHCSREALSNPVKNHHMWRKKLSQYCV